MKSFLELKYDAWLKGEGSLFQKECEDQIDPALFNSKTFDINKAKQLNYVLLECLYMYWRSEEALTDDPLDETIFLQLRQELKKREAEQN